MMRRKDVSDCWMSSIRWSRLAALARSGACPVGWVWSAEYAGLEVSAQSRPLSSTSGSSLSSSSCSSCDVGSLGLVILLLLHIVFACLVVCCTLIVMLVMSIISVPLYVVRGCVLHMVGAHALPPISDPLSSSMVLRLVRWCKSWHHPSGGFGVVIRVCHRTSCPANLAEDMTQYSTMYPQDQKSWLPWCPIGTTLAE